MSILLASLPYLSVSTHIASAFFAGLIFGALAGYGKGWKDRDKFRPG
jgi:ABC-type dipeptide/oligopeptide/nickel transport system permease subunit